MNLYLPRPARLRWGDTELERRLLAERGSQNLVFLAFLTSALTSLAAIELVKC